MTNENEKTITLKVAGGSNPNSVGGAIVKNLEENKDVYVLAVGAGAVNQATKAIAIASGFAAPQGMSLLTRVGFTDVDIEGEEKTALKWKIVVE